MRSSPEDPGRESELRLQQYRNNLFRNRTLSGPEAEPGESRAALSWIEALAEAGHWGAKVLLGRVARESTLAGQLAELDPGAATRLARLAPDAAYQAAFAAAANGSPDWTVLREWLELANLRALARDTVEAERICGRLERQDAACVARAMSRGPGAAGDWLVDAAEWRRQSPDAAHAEHVKALIDAAARMGSLRAKKHLMEHEWSLATDREALAESWCANYEHGVPALEVGTLLRVARPLAPAELGLVRDALLDGIEERGSLLFKVARMRHSGGAAPETVAAPLAAAIEIAARPELLSLWNALRGRGGDLPGMLAWWFEHFPRLDLDKRRTFLVGAWIERSAGGGESARMLAAQWYARAKGEPLEPGAPIPRSLCYFVAAFSNPHVSFRYADEPAISLEWLERGITLGNEGCLDKWLAACIRGELGLQRDPDAAMERVRRIMRALPGQRDPLGGFTLGLSAVVAHAKSLGDQRLARQWLEVAAEARYRDAIELLGKMAGGGS